MILKDTANLIFSDVLLGSLGKLKFNNETQLGMEALQIIMENPSFLAIKEAGLEVMEHPERLSSCVSKDFKVQCKHDRLVCFYLLLALAYNYLTKS